MDVEKSLFAMNYCIEKVSEHCNESLCWFYFFFNGLIFKTKNSSNQEIKAKFEHVNKRFMLKGLKLCDFVDCLFCSVEIEKM